MVVCERGGERGCVRTNFRNFPVSVSERRPHLFSKNVAEFSRVSVDTRASREEGNMVKRGLRVETGYGLVEDGVRLQKSVRTGGPLVFDSEKNAERARSECRAGPDRFRVVKVRILYS